MAILGSELKSYKAINTTGGVMSTDLTGDRLFSSATSSERINGSTTMRKLFMKVENTDNLTLSSAKAFMWDNTIAQDYVLLAPATQTDTVGTASTPRWYGAGSVTNINGTTITIAQESTVSIFAPADIAILSDKTDYSDEDGSSEFVTISSISLVGTTATVVVAELINTYSGSIKLSSCANLGDIHVSYSDVVVTSLSGTFDDTELVLNNIGAIDESWTVTFLSPTTYSVAGTYTGLVGTGSINAEFVAPNLDFPGFNYLSIPSAAWAGTYAVSDTVTFTTHPASVGIWFKRIIPAGCTIEANNQFNYVFIGDTE